MDEKTQVGPVITTIKALSKEYIKGVTLSDLYTGKNIPEGKKSLTFSIELRSDEKTLTDEDMKTVQQSIFQKLQTLGGEIRGI
jgi:phenylalanyl-tRNA synthetase beta chain